MVCSWYYHALAKTGIYNQLINIPLASVNRLIFVCSGNICRSPLAESVAKKMSFQAESFGLHCRGGDKADERAITFASKQGFDLKQHTTRNIREYQASPYDLVVAMEPKHVCELKQHGISSNMTSLPLWGLGSPYLHDPFNCSPAFFERCELQVVACTKTLIELIKKRKSMAP